MPTLSSYGPEVGATGNKFYNGVLYNNEDYNADLQNQAGMILFDKMRRSDCEISGGVGRLVWPLVSAEWGVDPPDVPRGEEMADFVSRVLLKREVYGRGLVDTSSDFIRQAANLMLTHGVMGFEKVWAVDENGDQVYYKIAPRLPKSYHSFEFKGQRGEFSALVQYAWDPRTGRFERKEVEAEKLALFVFGREGDNYWGLSILRSAYPNWDMKRKILWIDAGSLERFGMGTLEMHALEDATSDEKNQAEQVAREYRSGERQYLYTSHKFEAKFHHPPSGESHAIESAKYHDQQIERAMLVEFMATGTAQTGSRAVVSTKLDLLLLALQGTAKIIEDGTTSQLIVDLIDRKYGVQDDYPKFRCQNLAKMKGKELTDMLTPLKTAGLVKYDRRLEDFLRKINDLPDVDESTREEGLPEQIQGNGTEPGKVLPITPQGAKPDVKPGDQPKPAAARALSAKPAPTFSRPLFEHERFAAFSEIGSYLENEPDRIWHRVVAPYRERMIAKMARRAAKASDDQLAKGDIRGPVGPNGMEARLTRDLEKAIGRVYLKGRTSVLEEKARQHAGLAAMADREDDTEDVEPTNDQFDWIGTLVTSFVSGMVLALVQQAKDSGMVARNADRTESQQVQDVTSALQDLSIPSLQADLAGMIGTQFNNGRNEQALALQDEIETAFYSAVLDSNTCGPCFALDGEEHEVGDSEFSTPNPDCDGGDRCRCITVYVFREVAA